MSSKAFLGILAGTVFGAVLATGAVSGASLGPLASRVASEVVLAVTQTHTSVMKDDVTTGTLAASRTWEVEVPSPTLFGLATVFICVTDDSDGVTAVTMTCTGSKNNNTTDYELQDCTTASGVCTSSDASFSKALGADDPECWIWRLDIEGIEDFECTMADTGGDGSDTYDVDVVLSTKGG